MKNYLLNCDQKILKIIQKISREANRKNLKVYLVGGIVRDLILKRKNLDLDIVVEANAISFAQDLAKIFGLKIKSYGPFGTATLEWNNGIRIDFATARKESYPQPGALPVVQEGTLKDDLFRRDFAINALAIAIHKDCYAQLIDEFGGCEDIKNKKIRILHDQSFVDDPTRILRVIRFEQRFHFKIERKTLSLLKMALRSRAMDSVKPPRYFVEFKKFFLEEKPASYLKRLSQLDAFEWLDPRFKLNCPLVNSLEHNFRKIKNKSDDQICLIYFMALLEKSNAQIAHRILERFPFKRAEKKSILQMDKLQDIIGALSRRDLRPSAVYRLLKPFSVETIFYFRLRGKRAIVCQRIDRFFDEDRKVTLKINGKDLEQMGFAPGPTIGETLNKILYQKIDGRICSKRDEWKLAAELKGSLT